jgi:hypothetical protein
LNTERELEAAESALGITAPSLNLSIGAGVGANDLFEQVNTRASLNVRLNVSDPSDKITRARREVCKLEYLVTEPPVKFAQARAGLTDFERTQLEALSQFTSKTAWLEHRVQEATLTVKGARAVVFRLL